MNPEAATKSTVATRPSLLRRGSVLFAVAVLLAVAAPIVDRPLGTIDPVDRVDGADYTAIVAKAVATYHQMGYDDRPYLADYSTSGPYLGWGIVDHPKPVLDADGIPLARNGKAWVYNPVTIAQYALAEYGRSTIGVQAAGSTFVKLAARLVSMEGADGAFRYDYAWEYYLTKETYAPGWVSGMAQGQVLSVFARAWELTSDPRYLDAGRRDLTFMMTPIQDGGTRSTLADLRASWRDHPFIEEYIARPYSYTLNGYMFSLLGLYDWSQVDPSSRATADFRDGLASLRLVLPLYDLRGFSAYDLGYITHGVTPHVGINYHMIHIYLLHALDSVAPDPVLAHWEQVWADDVG